jgi:hypothetical protein
MVEILNRSEAGIIIKYLLELRSRLKIFQIGNSPEIEIVFMPRTSNSPSQRPKLSDWVIEKVIIKRHRFRIRIKGITIYSRRGLYCEIEENVAKLSTFSPDESRSLRKFKVF